MIDQFYSYRSVSSVEEIVIVVVIVFVSLIIVVVIVVVSPLVASLIVAALVVAWLILRGGASLLKIIGHFDIAVGQSVEE